MKNLNKATIYCILRSRDTIINLGGMMIVFVLIALGLYSGFLQQKSPQELILFMYVLILGMTLVVANSMIIDLTVKDKLSNRLEFFISSGISIKNIINVYTIQMLRIASIIPFLVFLVFYQSVDFKYDFLVMIIFYVTTVILACGEIYFFNTFSFSAKKNKLFKNIIFFGTFFGIYMTGMFSRKIVEFAENLKIDIVNSIIILNVCVFVILIILGKSKIKALNNEKVLNMKGEWI